MTDADTQHTPESGEKINLNYICDQVTMKNLSTDSGESVVRVMATAITRIIVAIPAILFTSTATSDVAIEGDLEDVRWFLEQLADAREVSDEFDALYDKLEDLTDPSGNGLRPTIQLVDSDLLGIFGDPASFRFVSLNPYSQGSLIPATPVGKYEGVRNVERDCDPEFENPPCTEQAAIGSSSNEWARLQIRVQVLVLDVADLKKIPNFEKSGDTWTLSGGVPDWMISVEEIIAHEIAEHYDGLVNGFCSYSCKCKSGSDNHVAGKRIENAVRRGFGQTRFRPVACGGSASSTEIPLGDKTVNVVVQNDRVVELTSK